MSVIEELEAAVASVAERVGPSVAGLDAPRWRAASAFVVAPGALLTYALPGTPEGLEAVFAGGRRAPVEALSADAAAGVALLRADTGDVPPVEWADDAPAVGRVVAALADPGGRGLRVTTGTVAATGRAFRAGGGRRVHEAIEHTAPLPRGAAGGPLVDLSGRLVGINVLRSPGGLILAAPAGPALRARLDDLVTGRAAPPPRLGVALAPAHVARRLRRAVGLPDREGLLVRGVEDGGPAAAAGVREGDLLVALDDRPVARVDDVFAALDARAGEAVRASLVRGVDEHTVAIAIALREEDA
jgi:serine protease Do